MRKVLLSGCVGNALEWYDFTIYAQFADVISTLFFPKGDSYLALLATWSVFAAGFIMRPLGAIVFGIIGDRFGRRCALILTILLMSLATSAMGLLPTYADIGIWAPIALTSLRLLQGLSLGGEFGGAIIYITEHASTSSRGLAGSLAMLSLCLGVLLGSTLVTATYWYFPEEAVAAGVWRYLFLLSFGFGLIGLWLRLSLQESPKYLAAVEEGELSPQPTRTALRYYRGAIFHAICIYFTSAIPFYTFVFYIKEILYRYYHMPQSLIGDITTLAMLLMTALIPIGGYLSDVYGRKTIMLSTCIGFIVLTYPIFMLFSFGPSGALAGSLLLAILVGIYNGPIPALLVELFPTPIRFTGVSLAYNTSAALFGGTAPMIYTFLIGQTGYVNIVALYVIGFAIISALSLTTLRSGHAQELT